MISTIDYSARESLVRRYITDEWAVFEYQPTGRPGEAWNETTARDAHENFDRLVSTPYIVGIVLGRRSRIVVLDIDPQNGGTLEALETRFGPMPATYTVSTPSGGTHLYYRYPDDETLRRHRVGELKGLITKSPVPGVDFLADGRNVAAPPSYRSGVPGKPDGLYSVTNHGPVAELPANVLAAWVEAAHPTRTVGPQVVEYTEAPAMFWPSVTAWHRDNVEEARNAPDGARDNVFYARLSASMQLARCVPDAVLSDDDVEADFEDMPYAVKDFAGKVHRATEFANANPRNPFAGQTVDFGDGKPYTPDPDFVSSVFTDNDVAARLAAYCDGRARYVSGRGWLVWTGSRWLWDNDEALMYGLANRVVDELKADLSEYLTRSMYNQPDSVGKSQAINAVRNVGNGVARILAVTSKRPEIRLSADQINGRRDLLGVANGVVNLATGDLLSNDPRYFITDVIEFEYHPDAPAPTWLRFLDDVFEDRPDMVDYLQLAFGYGITGYTQGQFALWHFGKGANGKTTMIEALRYVFAPTSASVNWSMFGKTYGGGDRPRPDLVRLAGKRLLFGEESNAGAQLDEGLFKKFFGEGTITARDLHKGEIEYRPQALLVMASNYRPNIRGVDDGIWRRFRFVSHLQKFEGDRRDERLPEKLKAEAEGILAWVVRGSVRWFKNDRKIETPRSVAEVGEQYRQASDELGEFLAANVVPDETECVKMSLVWNRYRSYANHEGLGANEQLKRSQLVRALEDRGYRVGVSHKQQVLDGLRLLPEPIDYREF